MKKAAFAAAIVGLASCNKVTAPSGGAMTEVEVRNAIKKDATLELPPSSKMTEFTHGRQLVDPSWAARFTVAPEERDALASKITALDKKVKVHGGITTTLPWWKPGRIVAEGSFKDEPDGLFIRVILSEENGQSFLYFEDATF